MLEFQYILSFLKGCISTNEMNNKISFSKKIDHVNEAYPPAS